ncbi:aldehyde dehydrogenase [Pseudomonas taeanensis MS-3]|uniref:Aldehyde dehydrogenase n=3 Tax=Pseudomonas TaxID=286 RepID=A0A0A1YEC6_9PSED|nr:MULTISPECIES: aldehyde dehydrogenase family protein [Pseudomonadaceae]MBH1967273.1 aldehyde dehydrogenase family protein [Pseudomonadales bacterium]CAB51050.1 aldehyde dehydrogenase [Pseudomonas putida]KAA6169821.1 aldehyde dehydrogenase family protein [Pseudomonas veronii]KAA6185557.1 aldehyde dehydrogenase family protein [Pseudomonas veronii]KFX68160.1 aldehyde dehydrogenase [Pseudomonas taeanensis MS-3]
MTMHTRLAESNSSTESHSVIDIFNAQKKASSARRGKFSLAERIAALNILKEIIQRRESEIIAALAADFRKPASEVKLTEIFPVLQEISHAKRNLKTWMMPRRVKAALSVLGTKARLSFEPKGVCLIIAPWNYPFNLSFGPLVSALAAGNSVIIKPSELTPHTASLIGSIIREAFSVDLVTVVEGDAAVSQELLTLPFDHIFFTGSPRVGKLVMEAAAKTLASVTLELGGKSPTIIGPTANLKKAARNIVWGKFSNNGQTCIAPDHVFVHRSIAHDFHKIIMEEVTRVYGKDFEAQKKSPDYCRIVNDQHLNRLYELIGDAKSKGAKILQGGEIDALDRFVAPTIISKVTPEMDISREEIFGPLLPIIEYDDIDHVIKQINDNAKPLALYIFSEDKEFAQDIVGRTSSGSVGINLSVVQFLHPNLPFGGVNNSGIGSAHGFYGFQAFSHEKPILLDRFSITHLLFPPYTGKVKRLISMTVRYLS